MLNFFDTGLCQDDSARLLFNGIIGFWLQARRPLRKPDIVISGFLSLARNDERRARFVNQDVVHFVNDGVVQVALHHLIERSDHVVAQVIKAELVVGAVGDIGLVCSSSFVGKRFDGVHKNADGQPQEFIDLSHPLGVTARQVIVDSDDVNALAGERIQVSGQRGDQGLTFTGAHLRDFPLVQYNTAYQLHVIMAHLYCAPTRFAHDGKCFGQDVFQRFACTVAFHDIGQQLIHRLGFQSYQFAAQAAQDIAKQRFQSFVSALFFVWGVTARLLEFRPRFLKGFAQVLIVHLFQYRLDLCEQGERSLLRVFGFVGPVLCFLRYIHRCCDAQGIEGRVQVFVGVLKAL